ncbi:MAG: hypothetical protein LBT43_15450 [Prevotella sp.]|jgi:hypothetical protein|nr:hypothetical protein [Prevotella sp.]
MAESLPAFSGSQFPGGKACRHFPAALPPGFDFNGYLSERMRGERIDYFIKLSLGDNLLNKRL